MLIIKKVNIEDESKYIELAKKIYDSEAVLHKISEENFKNTFYESIKSDIYLEIYLIEYINEIVGYFQLSKTFSNEVGGMVLLIEEIYLEKEYRSKGIGKKVFEYIYKNYKEYKRFRLEVSMNNIEVMRFYERLGFKKLDYEQLIIDFT